MADLFEKGNNANTLAADMVQKDKIILARDVELACDQAAAGLPEASRRKTVEQHPRRRTLLILQGESPEREI
ncbi:hypothetical protein [Nitrosospira multiformis]|uniref:hypothetical protein n=1 Tax=Nitrosospira multiformis TaxID=1231 RepID=UPI0015A4F9FA|nr:hypothetical protein [Nitrosospira multiformis]